MATDNSAYLERQSYRTGERDTTVPVVPTVSPNDPLTNAMATLFGMRVALQESVNVGNKMAAENAAVVQQLKDTKTQATATIASVAPQLTPKTTSTTTPAVGSDTQRNIQIFQAVLRGKGFPASLVNSSASYFNTLASDGITDPDTAISLFLDAKNYTTKNGQVVESPFYAAYGKFNEGLKIPYDAGTLFNTIEGYKNVVDKYSLNSKFVSDNSISQYLKNGVDVKTLDERANTARLKAAQADPVYTTALAKQGYIASNQDLQDFFMDPTIGTEVMDQRRNTASVTAEFLRQQQQEKALQFHQSFLQQLGAKYTDMGYTEAQAAELAKKNYATIAEELSPMTKLSGIYSGKQALTAEQVQTQLEQEQFSGLASQDRARLAGMEVGAFQGSAGLSGTSAYLRKTSLSKGTIGAL